LKESGHEKLLFLFFDPEDVGDMFILTLHWPSADYFSAVSQKIELLMELLAASSPAEGPITLPPR
jgi:hypothetical protein